jgi:hypothetical protein
MSQLRRRNVVTSSSVSLPTEKDADLISFGTVPRDNSSDDWFTLVYGVSVEPDGSGPHQCPVRNAEYPVCYEPIEGPRHTNDATCPLCAGNILLHCSANSLSPKGADAGGFDQGSDPSINTAAPEVAIEVTAPSGTNPEIAPEFETKSPGGRGLQYGVTITWGMITLIYTILMLLSDLVWLITRFGFSKFVIIVKSVTNLVTHPEIIYDFIYWHLFHCAVICYILMAAWGWFFLESLDVPLVCLLLTIISVALEVWRIGRLAKKIINRTLSTRLADLDTSIKEKSVIEELPGEREGQTVMVARKRPAHITKAKHLSRYWVYMARQAQLNFLTYGHDTPAQRFVVKKWMVEKARAEGVRNNHIHDWIDKAVLFAFTPSHNQVEVAAMDRSHVVRKRRELWARGEYRPSWWRIFLNALIPGLTLREMHVSLGDEEPLNPLA